MKEYKFRAILPSMASEKFSLVTMSFAEIRVVGDCDDR
tara:strand:+ start:191 stop:304 length:114 start_codon:yes stop_codon:yes gene_type:complete